MGNITALTSVIHLSPHIGRLLSATGSTVSDLHAETLRRAVGGRVDLGERAGGG